MDFKTSEISLAQSYGKKKKNWRLVVFGRRFLVIFMLLVQFVLFFLIAWEGSRVSVYLNFLFTLCGVLLSLSMIRRTDSSGYKLLWVFFFLSLPVFGVTFYFLVREQGLARKMRRRYEELRPQHDEALRRVSVNTEEPLQLGAYQRLSVYLQSHRGYTLSDGDRVSYYKTGEEGFAALIDDLEKAEKYIFLEYFIIDEGVLWARIFDVLCRKAKEGVEVRLMMDDMGCFLLKPRHFAREMESFGIKICVFNRFRPFISAIQNNRDHRKIAVIDGYIAHTGGANIADEYVNLRRRFGYWKDTTVRTQGPAAAQFAVMFLHLWDAAMYTEESWDAYLPIPEKKQLSDCFLVPFADSPFDPEPLCRNTLLALIQRARKSLYICTPYFLPDEPLLHALILASGSGVDVRVIIPYHADKKIVKRAGQTYFDELIRAGVRVYEYTPGFNHAKMIISDGVCAYVGSANFDYRSLFLHHECGAVVYGGEMPRAVQSDFEEMFSVSKELAEKPPVKFGYLQGIWQQLLRLFAPLM